MSKSISVLFALLLALPLAQAESQKFRLETFAGAKEVFKMLGDIGPGCSMGGRCDKEIKNLRCSWNQDAVGKLENSCVYNIDDMSGKDQSVEIHLSRSKAFRLMGYVTMAGVSLNQAPGLVETPTVNMNCTHLSAWPESGRDESYVCELISVTK